MTHPADAITPEELAANERGLVLLELQADRRHGTAADYEWWTRALLPYSAVRIHVLGGCPDVGHVTVVVKLRSYTSVHRRASIKRTLEGWLRERAPINHVVHVHLT